MSVVGGSTSRQSGFSKSFAVSLSIFEPSPSPLQLSVRGKMLDIDKVVELPNCDKSDNFALLFAGKDPIFGQRKEPALFLLFCGVRRRGKLSHIISKISSKRSTYISFISALLSDAEIVKHPVADLLGHPFAGELHKGGKAVVETDRNGVEVMPDLTAHSLCSRLLRARRAHSS